MISIDGSQSEGGGQILRTALSLSVLLQVPFKIAGIRTSRPNPGLQAQHLAAVNALAEISRAQVSGNSLGSPCLSFSPQGLFPGGHSFSVSTAGSSLLVLQTLLPPLLYASSPSRIEISGGTHVPWSPCFDYAEKVFAPAIRRMGAGISLHLHRHGFYPAGGGRISAEITTPQLPLTPFALPARGALKSVSGVSLASSLPALIAERQKSSALAALSGLSCPKSVEIRGAESASPGTCVFLQAEYGHCTEGFSSLGAKGRPAEAVGAEAARALLEFDSSHASVDAFLADQLLPYCALAAGESSFTVPEASSHFKTNAAVIREFLPEVEISASGAIVRVKGCGFQPIT
ncbi:MAG: RNA 3'-terminal phosphate cyclase [Candidatus Micrarchaeota archaeon]